MSTPKRESILAALATRLGAIRNPYPTDYEDAAIVTLLEGEETAEYDDYADTIARMSVTVERIDKYGEDDARETVANGLLATSIFAALGTDLTLGGLCEDMRYTGGATVFSDTGSALVGAVARFEITYRLVAGSPY
jgi:hypothetical protein